jgi:hypothetical protein
MASLAEYFELHRYKPKYFLGDRVYGKWNKIPFIGTVGNDTVVNEIEGPRISIQLDLPIKFEDKWHNIIIVKHKDVKFLTSFDTEETNDKNTNRKTSSKKPVLDSNGRKRKSR